MKIAQYFQQDKFVLAGSGQYSSVRSAISLDFSHWRIMHVPLSELIPTFQCLRIYTAKFYRSEIDVIKPIPVIAQVNDLVIL